MKKLLLLLAILMTAVLLFASCGTEIENGEIDIDDETIAALPCSVDVEGLEGVSGTVSVDLVTEAEKTDALSKVKEGYYVADGAATYAVEISLKKDGEDVAPGKPITVKIGLKTHDLPLDQYTVFHIHGDRVTEIVPTVTEDSLTFSVSDFSIFLVVPKHVHTPGALVVDTPATCTATGTGHIPCSVCGKTVEDKTIDKTAHAPGEWIDDAAAGKSYRECSVCHNRVEEKPYTPPATVNNRFAGVTLGYVGYNGAIYDKTVFPTSTEVNAFLSRIRISLFNDGIADGAGNVTGARFEIVSTGDDWSIEWAIFGTWSAEANALSCEMQVGSYYDGETGKYYHGQRTDKFPHYVAEVNGGLVFNTEKGLFELASYISGSDAEGGTRSIAVKGSFFFEKTTAAPAPVTGLPEDTGEDVYERFVENKVFTFSGATSTGSDGAAYNTAYAGATVQFFADNYAEFRRLKAVRAGTAVDFDLVLGGSYTIEETADGYEIVLVPAKRFLDGEETAVVGGSVTLSYDAASGSVRYVEYSDAGFVVTSVFALSADATPTKYVAPPVADNWDADLIAAAFRAVGATKDVTLPKLDCVQSMTKSDVVGGKVTVTIVMASGSAARQAADRYKGQTIPRAFENTRFEGNFEYYLTAHNEAEFGIFVNVGNGTVTIEITAFEPAFPASAINALLTERGVTDGIVDFKNENAVEYVWDNGTLYVSLRYDADASAVMTGYVDALTRTAGYGTDLTTNGKTVYVSENEQIVFYLTTDRLNGRARVAVSFLDASVLPIREYPADLIASLLDGTDDDFFNFGQANATEYRPIYHAGDFEGTFHVYLPAKAGQDGAAAAEAIYNGFVSLGYLNNDLRFTYGDENCRRNGLVSPDREILVRVTGYDAETMIKWGFDGTYTYAVVEIVNLTMVEDLAWVTSIEVTPNVTRYNLGAGFYFDANVTAVFSNGKREKIPSSSDAIEIPTPPDTDTEGVKTVTVVYLGTFTDTYQITVSDVVTGITATGFTTTWYLNDVWSFDGTLTAIWEKKGVQPLSVDDVTFYPAPDMTTLGTKHVTVTLKTDETISASVDFVVRPRTVSFEYRNTDEWDITEGYAKFAVYAVGGDFNGPGKWVNVRQSRGVFTGSVDKDTTSFYIVRLSVETDVFEEGVNYDLESEGVLNVSEALTIPNESAGDVPTFSFGAQ